MHDHSMNLMLKASLDTLPMLLDGAEHALCAFGIDAESRAAILLSIDELFSNIVLHGQLDADSDIIRLELAQCDNTVCVDIYDPGPAFDPVQVTPSETAILPDSASSNMAIGGWGLMLVKALATEVQYTRENDANHIRLIFALPLSPGAAKSSV